MSENLICEVQFCGQSQYPIYDQHPSLGTFERNDTVYDGRQLSLEAAIRLAEKMHCEGQPDSLPYDDGWGERRVIPFRTEYVEITDAKSHLVIGGVVEGNNIQWIKPAYEPHEIAKIKAQQRILYQESSIESGWDNYETARCLQRDACILGLMLGSLNSHIFDQLIFCCDVEDNRARRLFNFLKSQEVK
jgi:hypothetical protein